MAKRVCPWWVGYFLISPVRRLMHDPGRILRPYVEEGMLVVEPGCGMGYFTIELARLVGPRGKVVAVDLQEKMLSSLRKRLARADLAERVETRLAAQETLGLDDLAGRADFALAFAVVHEMPDQRAFFSEVHQALRTGGRLLVAEPKGHVMPTAFKDSMESAVRLGFRLSGEPVIKGSRSAVLERL